MRERFLALGDAAYLISGRHRSCVVLGVNSEPRSELRPGMFPSPCSFFFFLSLVSGHVGTGDFRSFVWEKHHRDEHHY